MRTKEKDPPATRGDLRQVSEQIFDYLKVMITSGEWKPGDKIPAEMKLCSELHVSRVSLRNAIARLECMGFLESFRGRGTFVRKSVQPMDSMYSTIVLNRADRLDVFEYRKILESASAEFAAQRATTEMVNEMNESIREMREAATVDDIIKYDWQFHHQLSIATGNKLIIRNFEILRDAYMQQFTENVKVMGSRGWFGHRNILAAIEIRDPALARQAMIDHLDWTMRELSSIRIDVAVAEQEGKPRAEARAVR